MSGNDENFKEEAMDVLIKYQERGRGAKGVLELYDETFDKYEEYMSESGLEYGAPHGLVEALAQVIGDDRNIEILDIGAGTGLVGVELAKLGFKVIDALDPSARSLDMAKAKGVYRKFLCQFVGPQPVECDDNSYDVAIMCGCLTENHMPKEGLLEMIKVVKPGGIIAMAYRQESVRCPWYDGDLEPYLAKLEGDGAWKLHSKTTIHNFVIGKDGLAVIYRVL